ncbi:hypothetical protein K501DRAFT_180422 [Backusella circina FSU 941]|nr:hypothetical protein K501DRAFT_180422 [Backusella circina FSU 941]
MALPFGLGCAVSVGLYKLQNKPEIPFSSFLLFLGVSMAITAFPVLARILAELKLLRTKVGAITMSSGLINDCIAWVLLALVVALLNSSGGLEALYVFLTAVGFSLFIIFAIGPLYRRLCIYTNSFEDGPSPLLMTVTLMLVLACAFVTDIIGVHALFGGFIAGVIVPHDNDLPIKITEKIEDVVNIIFLPLYFTLSGLKTQIGLLNTGPVWGYVILVIFLACFGKIVGCTLAARFSGMTARESVAVGFLMNCKGLVELIVLNIGHDAGVLNDQVFVIMVVMALITTFMTTPVVLKVYPEWYQRETADKFHSTDISQGTDTPKNKIEDMSIQASAVDVGSARYCLVAMLNKIESAPSIMALIKLLTRDKKGTITPEIHALRLLELTQRPSTVMKSKDLSETKRQDPVLNVLRTFANLIDIKSFQTQLDFCPVPDYIKTVSNYGNKVDADLILLPITARHFQDQQHPEIQTSTTLDIEFIEQAFTTLQHRTVGVFIDRGFGHIQDGDADHLPQIVVSYQGSADDRAALLFALRLQAYRKLDLMVLRLVKNEQNTKLYASTSTIQEAISSQEIDLDHLFKETDQKTNVICMPVTQLDSTTLSTSTARPLGKHDLLLVGRHQFDEASSQDTRASMAVLLQKVPRSTSVLIIQTGDNEKNWDA